MVPFASFKINGRNVTSRGQWAGTCGDVGMNRQTMRMSACDVAEAEDESAWVKVC